MFGHDDNMINNFYQGTGRYRPNTLVGYTVVQEDRNAESGRDAQTDLGTVCGPYCIAEMQERVLKLPLFFLHFALSLLLIFFQNFKVFML